jgi:hypothetical protein
MGASERDQPGGDPLVPRGRADRAEQDGVVGLELLERLVGQGLTGLQPVLGAEPVVGGLELDVLGQGRAQDLERLCGDLGTDPVAADDGEVDQLRVAADFGVAGHAR